jgi:hypothetical protein
VAYEAEVARVGIAASPAQVILDGGHRTRAFPLVQSVGYL